MLALLAEFVMQIMARICDVPISRYNENLQVKRSVLAKLLELYNATEVLLAASEHVANEFRSYSDGTETVTRIVSAKRLKDVHEKFEAFSKCIDETSGILKIYDVGISVLLSNTLGLKGAIWKHIVLDEIVLPKMLQKNGRPTFTLQYPTQMPKLGRMDIIAPDIRRESLDERVASIVNSIHSSCEFVEVEINDREQLISATAKLAESVDALRHAKQELARFISSNFEISQVFDAIHLLKK